METTVSKEVSKATLLLTAITNLFKVEGAKPCFYPRRPASPNFRWVGRVKGLLPTEESLREFVEKNKKLIDDCFPVIDQQAPWLKIVEIPMPEEGFSGQAVHCTVRELKETPALLDKKGKLGRNVLRMQESAKGWILVCNQYSFAAGTITFVVNTKEEEPVLEYFHSGQYNCRNYRVEDEESTVCTDVHPSGGPDDVLDRMVLCIGQKERKNYEKNRNSSSNICEHGGCDQQPVSTPDNGAGTGASNSNSVS